MIVHCPLPIALAIEKEERSRLRREGKIHVDKALPSIARPHFLSQTLSPLPVCQGAYNKVAFVGEDDDDEDFLKGLRVKK